jgi:hypothetical protein
MFKRPPIWLLVACAVFCVMSQTWEMRDIALTIQAANDDKAPVLSESIPLQADMSMLVSASTNRFDAIPALDGQQSMKTTNAFIKQSYTVFIYNNNSIPLKLRI